MKPTSKFRSTFSPSEIDIFTKTVDGEVNLDEEYPVLYQKIYKFYRNYGIQFIEDDEDDKYSMIINQISKDLELY